MTPEEIQRTIEGMLQVQRLQNSQLQLKERQDQFQEELEGLKELSRSSERKLERLIGYSITQEGDILDTKEEIASLKARVSALEQKQSSGEYNQ